MGDKFEGQIESGPIRLPEEHARPARNAPIPPEQFEPRLKTSTPSPLSTKFKIELSPPNNTESNPYLASLGQDDLPEKPEGVIKAAVQPLNSKTPVGAGELELDITAYDKKKAAAAQAAAKAKRVATQEVKPKTPTEKIFEKLKNKYKKVADKYDFLFTNGEIDEQAIRELTVAFAVEESPREVEEILQDYLGRKNKPQTKGGGSGMFRNLLGRLMGRQE